MGWYAVVGAGMVIIDSINESLLYKSKHQTRFGWHVGFQRPQTEACDQLYIVDGTSIVPWLQKQKIVKIKVGCQSLREVASSGMTVFLVIVLSSGGQTLQFQCPWPPIHERGEG